MILVNRVQKIILCRGKISGANCGNFPQFFVPLNGRKAFRPCGTFVGLRADIILGNQRKCEKNSGKKNKSIPYNTKIVECGFNGVRITLRIKGAL